MIYLAKTFIKICLLAVFLYGVSQFEINDRKIYSYVESFTAKMLYRYGRSAETKIIKSTKKSLARYLKDVISRTLENDTRSDSLNSNIVSSTSAPKTIIKKIRSPRKRKRIYKRIIRKEKVMDEKKLQELLGD